jgi:hypothetical protein
MGGETGFFAFGKTSGFAQCKSHLIARTRPKTVKQNIPPGIHPKTNAPTTDASLNATLGGSGIDCQARYPMSEPIKTADQNARTPTTKRIPGQTHPDMRPAKKDATAAITQPNKKIGRNVSWYGVMSSSKWILMRQKARCLNGN